MTELMVQYLAVCVFSVNIHHVHMHGDTFSVHLCRLYVCVCIHERNNVCICDCLHASEGDARLLCSGEAGTPMAALCLLAQEAKGHEMGINYIVRERCVLDGFQDYHPFKCIYLLDVSISCQCAVWSSNCESKALTQPGLGVSFPLEL